MSRYWQVAAYGTIAAAWCCLRLADFDVPNPPLMQTYALICKGKDNAALAFHAARYLWWMLPRKRLS